MWLYLRDIKNIGSKTVLSTLSQVLRYLHTFEDIEEKESWQGADFRFTSCSQQAKKEPIPNDALLIKVKTHI